VRHSVHFPSPPIDLPSFLSRESDHSHSTGLVESQRMGCFHLLSGCGFASHVCGNCFFVLPTSRLLIVSHDHRSTPSCHCHQLVEPISVVLYSKLTGRPTVIVLAYCTVPVTLSGKLDPFLTSCPTGHMISPTLPHPVIMRNSKAKWVFLVKR